MAADNLKEIYMVFVSIRVPLKVVNINRIDQEKEANVNSFLSLSILYSESTFSIVYV